MFNQRSTSLIESDEGFTVFMKNNAKIIYSEGVNRVSVGIEILVNPIGALVYSSSIKTWEPEGRAVSDSDRIIITQNISRALHFAGYICEVQ